MEKKIFFSIILIITFLNSYSQSYKIIDWDNKTVNLKSSDDDLQSETSISESYENDSEVDREIQSELNSCKYRLASWAPKWKDYVPVDHPPTH